MDGEAPRTMIEAEGLTKFFGPFVAIKDISFSIPVGQIVAFLGPNGAGKSTTIKILTGYMGPSAGRASIAGCDVRSQRLAACSHLGYLPENGPLYPDMTPLELLSFFGEARGLEANGLRERIEVVTQQCGLDLVLEKPIGKLSKGLRQRVGLAQAMLHDPDVLIMDEPTAGLDPNQIRDFRSNLLKLREERQKTILISTHILQEVEAVAERVLFIANGQLAFDGKLEDLREGGSLEAPFHRLTQPPPSPKAAPATPEPEAAPAPPEPDAAARASAVETTSPEGEAR